MYLEAQYPVEEMDLFEEINNQSFNEMETSEYIDSSEYLESDSSEYSDSDNEETEEFDSDESDEDCQYFDHLDQAITHFENLMELQKESEADEEVMKDYMRKVLNLFSFDTLLWIKEALDSRKIANVFEIFTTDENVPATIEKDRQFYLNSIKNIKYGILSNFLFRYRSKIDGQYNAEYLQFILSKYLEFQQNREESLANLYKLVKNLQAEFIKSTEIDFKRNFTF